MNLTDTANLAKKLFIPIFVVVVIIILVILISYRFANKEEKIQLLKGVEIPSSLASKSKINFDTTQLKGPNSTPQNLAVFQIKDSESFIAKSGDIASKFNINTEPSDTNDASFGKGKLFSDGERALLVYPHSITYQKNSSTENVTTQDPNLLSEKARDFLTNLNLNSTLRDQAEIKYEKVFQEHLQETQDKSQAQFITLKFPNTINGYPLIGKFEPNKITFDSDGNIFKFDFNHQPTKTELGNYPIISLEEAVNQLNAGKGSLIKTESEFEDTRIHTEIKNAKLENAYLAYYLQSTSGQTIQPVWVFEGTTTIEPTLFEVTFAVPAIDPKFLIPTQTPPPTRP